ncbi:MAG: methicillin resistance protein [Candidatus Delongbacteria bacterium]|nr:methicillin resistance protein [Candidatus Delongbacteria bacterium]
MRNKELYIDFCKSEKNIPIFNQYWWLDAVCGSSNWNVILVENDNSIIAALPYYLNKTLFFKFIIQPILTPFCGVFIKYPNNQKYSKKLSYEKSIINNIIKDLNSLEISYFDQYFHYDFTNWLPFFWKGFQETTRYTYVIDDIRDHEKVYSDFSNGKKKNINKAKNEIEVKFDLDPEIFYQNHKSTLGKQSEEIIYSLDTFLKIYKITVENDCGKIIYAIDKNGNIHSAIFFVWDAQSGYDLISTIDPDLRNSGSASLLIYKIIEYLSDKTIKFDFEGSMIENVEHSFRQFGAVQKKYFNIYKGNPLLRTAKEFLRNNKKLFNKVEKFLIKR